LGHCVCNVSYVSNDLSQANATRNQRSTVTFGIRSRLGKLDIRDDIDIYRVFVTTFDLGRGCVGDKVSEQLASCSVEQHLFSNKTWPDVPQKTERFRHSTNIR